MKRLALVERNLLTDPDAQPVDRAIQAVVRLHRAGWQLLLLADRPERWRPTRKSMDAAMGLQRSLHEALTGAGGDLDGICYLSSGLFTRRRDRYKALLEIADRYGIQAGQLTVISGEPRHLEAADAAGTEILAVGVDQGPPGSHAVASLQDAVSALIAE